MMIIAGEKTAGFFEGQATAKAWGDWRWQYKNRIRSLPALAEVVDIPRETAQEWRRVVKTYPMSITPYYLSLMEKSNPNDPLLRQCVPDIRELEFSLGGQDDPLEEHGQMPVPGLVHRYRDRCLILTTQTCAVYCRHCNRKRLWKKNDTATSYQSYFQPMMDYIATAPHIREVILSGGDPLTLADETIDWLLGSLRSISHIRVLRIGSRVPVVMPMRITADICAVLQKHRPLWLNTQFNHPREITPESAAACDRLLTAGIPVSNQSVLLKGVNDDVNTMRDLLNGLQEISVRPYYLFQCDPVRGTDHFRTEVWEGMRIMEQLWSNLSGLCLPRYVLDVPGAPGKIALQPFSLYAPHGAKP